MGRNTADSYGWAEIIPIKLLKNKQYGTYCQPTQRGIEILGSCDIQLEVIR